MYGLSIDPKNANLSLQEIYDKAKSYVTWVNDQTSTKEKERKNSMAGEKPGADSASFQRLKKLSADDAAKEAAKETIEKLGPLPQA